MQPFRRGVPVKATLNQPRAAPRHFSWHPHLGSRYLRDFMPFLGQHTSYAYKSLYQSFACAAFEIWNSLNYTCLFIYINLVPIQCIRFIYW